MRNLINSYIVNMAYNAKAITTYDSMQYGTNDYLTDYEGQKHRTECLIPPTYYQPRYNYQTLNH